MKYLIKTLIVFFITSSLFGQTEKEKTSKMLNFVSKTGVILKFEDYRLPNIKSSYSIAECKIRKIISGNEEKYFLQISKKGKYDTKTASIAYEDVMEIQKAILRLKAQVEIDLNTKSDYLENKFITEDGFEVGYYINKEKSTWYINLEKYGSNNTLFTKNYEILENAFQLGKEKIEELKL
ncbi:hypothetical protein [Tenacibaculum sp. IB213877]|uniref:hypothetical protein n=1 Tax=Tenacibaculum sp. IB213877 TaxID=3097351 RepID=UPI002A5B0D6A|nr:hypothetical protein [Tenacibaculum sp. IB213877]MDY0780967.1 hypothetical protein [Tenacibaculum sp. IB213877]